MVEGDGTVAFDAQLQPVAALSTKMQGLGRLADALGTVSDGNAETLRSAARAATSIATPVNLQNGKVWIGSVAIADQPQLIWPEN